MKKKEFVEMQKREYEMIQQKNRTKYPAEVKDKKVEENKKIVKKEENKDKKKREECQIQ